MPDFLLEPWPWYVSGTMIASVMLLLLYFGKSFGFSSNLRTICAACGGGKHVSFFDFDWKAQTWNLVFLVGAFIGGYVAAHYFSTGEPVKISESTISDIALLGFSSPVSVQPGELFSNEVMFSLRGFLILAAGGFLVGFGTRWAGGCTSGHAISGLSNLQVPSLIAVIGFFAGGLIMTHLIMPLIF
jgi:uncharacterized membrane protein YedE/YeeE